ncbi:MAG: GntR family transcriptional regulator [Pseudomonadota bacterium]
MTFQSIKPLRKRLAEEAYDQILGGVLRGDVGPEDRLVQEKLAAELEISRTPVREALLRLEGEGILETAPTGGFRLRTLSRDEVQDLYEARAAVEGQAIRLAAVRGGAEAGARLAAVVREAEGRPGRDVHAYFEANRDIHRAIVEESGNRWLLTQFDTLWNRGVSFRLFAAIETVDLSRCLGDHLTLAEAVAAGDGPAAQEAMQAHVADGLNLQVEAMRDQWGGAD